MESLKTTDQNQTAQPEISPLFIPHIHSLLLTPGDYITHNAT